MHKLASSLICSAKHILHKIFLLQSSKCPSLAPCLSKISSKNQLPITDFILHFLPKAKHNQIIQDIVSSLTSTSDYITISVNNKSIKFTCDTVYGDSDIEVGRACIMKTFKQIFLIFFLRGILSKVLNICLKFLSNNLTRMLDIQISKRVNAPHIPMFWSEISR